MIDGQLDAVRVGGRVVRQQVQRRDVGGHYVLRRKALRHPVGGGAGRIGGGDLGVIQQVRRLSHVPQGLTQRGGAADGVAVGPHVRQDQHVVHAPQGCRRLPRGQSVPAHSRSSGSTMSALAGLAGFTWLRRSRMCAPWAMESSMMNCSSGVYRRSTFCPSSWRR